MLSRALALTLAASAPAAWADAPEYALQGYHGLLRIPDAGVTPEGTFNLQYNTDIESTAPASFDSAENSYLTLGVWPGVELTGRVSVAETEDGRRVRNDLSGNIKIRFYDSEHFSFAAGASDFAGTNNRGGDTRQLQSAYGVGTFRWRGWALTLGGGGGPDTLEGPFGGVRYRPLPFVDLIAEHDGEAFNYGTRLHWRATRQVQVYGIANGSADEEQKFSAGVGLAIQFGNRRQRDLAENPSSALSRKARPDSRARVTSTDYPANANELILRRLEPQGHAETVTEYRYGVPVRTATLNANQAASDWHALSDGWSSYRWRRWIGGEIRIEPDVRSLVATDYGVFDYSLAIQPSIRIQAPYGFAAYGTYDAAVSNSDDVERGARYDNLLHESSWREIAGQWLIHALPGWFTLATTGMTEVDEVRYGFVHVDTALHDASGRHQLRAAYARYEPEQDLYFEPRELGIAAYRYFWPRKQLAIRVSYGNYFYDDRGGRLEVTRFFGDFAVRLFYLRDEDGLQQGGLGLSIPLSIGSGLRAGPFSVNGSPRWEYAVASTIDNPGPGRRNIISRGNLFEPVPEYNLIKDVLDQDRAIPANLDEAIESLLPAAP